MSFKSLQGRLFVLGEYGLYLLVNTLLKKLHKKRYCYPPFAQHSTARTKDLPPYFPIQHPKNDNNHTFLGDGWLFFEKTAWYHHRKH